jgi:DNA polymerase III delta subunit
VGGLAAAKRYPLAFLWSLLERCAEADLAIKGQLQSDPWTLLAGIAEDLANPPRPARRSSVGDARPR